ncbi:hypothetical protein DB30_04608 [Enhygromyxa salina]|uniref:Gram-negative bacterial tonB protein n=1 Tax=Enhygromyxa salina TaxID=215803 RepID=A0A0C2A6W5_9BACT|nr:hypothetical protein [Enhygromyxa salina]KIG19143.1 hypothetical protein DB30_04608 [Enhygromyxa salina]
MAGTNIQATATEVRGKVSRNAVATRLGLVDAVLPSCWTEAVTAGAKAPMEVELSLVIRWSGSANSIKLKGASAPLDKCIRAAVPTSGWPKPSDGGDANVTRSWTFGG